MWFLPLLVIGAIVAAVASRSKRAPASPQRQLPPAFPPRSVGLPRGPGSPGVPGPISVLGEILRIGQTPPPTVILCAIAEAQALGRNDLASDIVQVFVAPVVYHHQRARARGGHYERGSCELAPSPRHAADSAPPPPFASWSTPPPVVPRTEVPASAAPSAAASTFAQTSMPSMLMQSMDDEINSLLHADPARFMEMVSRSGTFAPRVQVPQASSIDPPIIPAPAPSAPSPIVQPTGLPSGTVAQMQEAAGLPQAADRTRTLAPGSPIPSVADSAWRDFVVRLEREAPTFNSSRHVGQYRHRRERLADLGIDPRAIHGSPLAQRAALDADLADAHNHAAAGGLLEHLGRAITVPGHDNAETISLSGMLGVIQCAGLDGAVGWLERPNDRKRYPHTTQAFLHTNGVF